MTVSNLQDIGGDLALLLDECCSSAQADKVARETGTRTGLLFGDKKRTRIRSELSMAIAAVIIHATNEMYNAREAKLIVDEFLYQSRQYLFDKLALTIRNFHDLYADRLSAYLRILSNEKPMVGISSSLLNNLGARGLPDLESQLRLAAFIGSARSEALSILQPSGPVHQNSRETPDDSAKILEELKAQIAEWPAKQAKIALELIVAVAEGNEADIERLYPELTLSQFQTVTGHLKRLEEIDE